MRFFSMAIEKTLYGSIKHNLRLGGFKTQKGAINKLEKNKAPFGFVITDTKKIVFIKGL